MTIKDIRPPEDVEGLLAYVGRPREAWQDRSDRERREVRQRFLDAEPIDLARRGR